MLEIIAKSADAVCKVLKVRLPIQQL